MPEADGVADALLERDFELDTLDLTLRGLAAGRGGVVVIEAAAGVGKSTLLRHVRAAMGECTVLSARGAELERDFTFGAVQQLFGPVLAGPGGAELFRGAARVAERLFTPADDPPHSIHPLLDGLYWLLVNLAATGPVALLVDDAQWLDVPSLQFLGFLARRLDSVAAALVITCRGGERDDCLLDDIAATGVVLEPGNLSETAVGALVRDTTGQEPAAEFRAACHAITKGNPLFVHGLLGVLAAQGIRPDAAASASVAAAGPDALRRHLVARLRRQPAEVRAVAVAVAVLGDGMSLDLVARQAEVTPAQTADAAERLVRSGVFERDDPPAFVHAVVRDVVLGTIPPSERSARHERAAKVLTEAALPVERVASHLLRTTPDADPGKVAVLIAAAEAARRQGSPDNAAVYLRRALRESPPRAVRSEVYRLLGNSEAHRLATREADTHLRAALALADSPAQRSLVAFSLARLRNACGATDEAIDLLAMAADQLPPGVPDELVAELEAERIGTERVHLGSRSRLVAHLAAFRQRPGRSPAVEDAQLAMEAVLAGQADEAATLARRALAGDRLRLERTAIWAALQALMVVDCLAEAQHHLGRALDAAVHRGLLFPLPLAHAFLARIAFLRGDLVPAAEHVEKAGRDLRSPHFAESARDATELHLRIEAGQAGDDVPPASVDPKSGLDLWLLDARTRAHRDPRAKLADALQCEQSYERWGATRMPDVPWRLRAAEAHARLGDRERAAALVTEELRLARSFGVARHVGIALRSAAELAPTRVEARALLTESAALLERGQGRLELARTLSDLGTLLLDEDRAEGRATLTRAADLAARCGAAELGRRIGAALQDATPAASPAFTPAEQQVAELATAGLTNRQIAERLYLSEKTVEAHLSRAYRKLGVRSRTQLAVQLAGAGRVSHAGRPITA
ncbi:AAA family ATPase [Amycolatopsis sp. NPDC026612]|uniref:ATP-binding protein n=1 Tax=Amycolatopsis sp. NPDC026612 TaxID=3155466 RepID=UPI0033C6FB53